MARRARWYVVIPTLLLVTGLAVTLFLFWPQATAPERIGPIAVRPAAEQIRRGEYLARAADCIACHTADKQRPFAGGVPFKTAFGTLYSPNITPDRDTGIGRWTDADFLRALHEGKDDQGQHLYPAFPYTAYTLLSSEDVLAIKAYLFSQTPIAYRPPENRLRFPFNHRWLLTAWNRLYFEPGRFQSDLAKSSQWNRGAYLVEALGHCAECHTPRTALGGLKNQPYAGAHIQGWYAYNITPDVNGGIGSWRADEIVRYLSTGVVPGKASASGPMAEVVENSTRYLSQADLAAMAAYLRNLPPMREDGEQPRTRRGSPATDVASWRGSSTPPSRGAFLYNANCASCHGWSGIGVGGEAPGAYPSLLHHSTVGAEEATNLVQVILHGVDRRGAGAHAYMPAFGHLSDADVAALASYVTRQFGDPAVTVSTADVAKARKGE